ncbi:MAG: hypothetical protein ACXAC8_04225 [Candidatus Hodarchaeales archaeon]|jgi:hypothetical protein
MPFCPSCGSETGVAKFCPNCGATQGAAVGGPPIRYQEKKKERYIPWLGAILCCCLGPLPLFLYYYFTEPEADGLQKTFVYAVVLIIIECVVFFGFFIVIMLIFGVSEYDFDVFMKIIPQLL